MNDEFHKTMKNVILKDIPNHGEYRAGPVKRMTRCQAKSETDYAFKPFPNRLSILIICLLWYFTNLVLTCFVCCFVVVVVFVVVHQLWI